MSPSEEKTHLADESATREQGVALGRGLEESTVVCLSGNLGAGKTTLVKGIVEGLECPVSASSPTFALVQEYSGGRLPVFHFDFYRIGNAAELIDLGWDDYLDRRGVVIIEWPELYPEMLPSDARWFQIVHVESGGRTISSLKNSNHS